MLLFKMPPNHIVPVAAFSSLVDILVHEIGRVQCEMDNRIELIHTHVGQGCRDPVIQLIELFRFHINNITVN